MRTTPRRIRVMVGLLLAFTLLAAACGGDEEATTPAAPETEAPDAPEADTTEEAEASEPDTTEEAEASEPDTTEEAEAFEPGVESDEAAEYEAESLEDAELRMVIWDERQLEVHEQMVDAFQQYHPNIAINVEVIPADYWTVVKTQIAGGDPPDIMWINVPNYPDLALNDALLPITDLVARDGVDLSPFPQSLVDSYTLNGELYGISKDYDTVGLFYRADLFDAAGLDYPDETWTWDDLKAAAAALTTDDVWGYAGGLSIQEFELNLVRQNGGELVSADGTHTLFGEPAACEAIQFLYSFHTDGTAPDQVTQDASHHWGLFADGRVAMMQDGSWAARGYLDSPFDIDVAPLPAGPEGRANTIHGLAWGILSDTDHPEAAWAFLKFLATEAAHLMQAETGAVIPSYAGTRRDVGRRVRRRDERAGSDRRGRGGQAIPLGRRARSVVLGGSPRGTPGRLPRQPPVPRGLRPDRRSGRQLHQREPVHRLVHPLLRKGPCMLRTSPGSVRPLPGSAGAAHSRNTRPEIESVH